MGSYLLRRLTQLLPVLILASIAVFLMIHLVPGDPVIAILGIDATPEQYAAVTEELRLDEPLVVQYFTWLGQLLQGNLGTSFANSMSVTELIGQRLPATIQLAVATMLIGLIIGIPLGMLAAARPRSIAAKLVSAYTATALAVPTFWFGVLFILLFGILLGWLPTAASYVPLWVDPAGAIIGIVGPALTLGFFVSGIIARFVRSSVLDALGLDFVLTARAKGASKRSVLYRHAFRAAALPTLTIVGIQLGAFIGGAVVTESVFNYPGFGRLLLTAVRQRDFPVLQGGIMFVVLAFAVVTLAVDVLYGFLNPKIRYAR